MGSSIEPKYRDSHHSTRFGELVAAGRLYRLRRVHALFDSCVETRSENESIREPRRAFAIASKVMALSLCAMLGATTLSLGGCAQFEDSLGELRGPVKQSATPTISQHSDPARSNEISDDASLAQTTGDSEWSYSLSGLRLELAPGVVTQ
jgi:hypothetical protein